MEVSFISALPTLVISGYAENVIKEAKERVQSALNALNFKFPPLKITINLSPSDLPKYGSHFDLPIALLIASQKSNGWSENIFAFGELGLDGSLKHSDNLLMLILDVIKECPDSKIILPLASKAHLENIPNLNAHYAQDLSDAISALNTNDFVRQSVQLDFKKIEVDNTQYFYEDEFKSDFMEVKGQRVAKRAALIACAGMHNIIFEGTPGCGKSMIAKRMIDIMPPLSLREILENSRIKSMANQSIALSAKRSFRSPHHSASLASIVGSVSKRDSIPGELALAHHGILFFDELPHFHRNVLESMREPLENGKITVSRAYLKIDYETSFLFIAAQNPCPCGYLLSTSKECRCSAQDISNYQKRISGPFLDRIDMFVQMQEENMSSDSSDLDSKSMNKAVLGAFVAQKKRGQIELNGKMSTKEIERFCKMDRDAQSILESAKENLALSMRTIDKVKKVARTIADLANAQDISRTHVLEALSYRQIKTR